MPSYSPFGAPERAVTAAAPPTGMSLAPHLRYSSTAERGQRPRHPSLRHRLHTLCTIPPDSSRRLTFALCRRAAGTCVPDDLPGEPESAAANDAATMGTLSNVSVGADDGAVEALLRLLTRPQFLVPPCSFPPPLRPRPPPSFRSQGHRRDRGLPYGPFTAPESAATTATLSGMPLEPQLRSSSRPRTEVGRP